MNHAPFSPGRAARSFPWTSALTSPIHGAAALLLAFGTPACGATDSAEEGTTTAGTANVAGANGAGAATDTPPLAGAGGDVGTPTAGAAQDALAGAGTAGAAPVELPPGKCGLPTLEDGTLLVTADAAHNYHFTSHLLFEPTLIAPSPPESEWPQPRSTWENGGEADPALWEGFDVLNFDWSGLTLDFLGHDVNLDTDIDMITLMLWKLTTEELAQKMNDDSLVQADLAALATFYLKPDETFTTALTGAGVLDFTSFGLAINAPDLLDPLNPDLYPPETHTYTIIAATGTTAGQGTRMIKAFKLDPTSDNRSVVMDNSSTTLDWKAEILSAQTTLIPSASAALTVDWTAMTENALGQEFVPRKIREVMVAKFSLSPAELETQFLDLDLIADDMWRGEVASGTKLDLSTLTNAAGEPFTGIDDTGTWIAAYFCTSCSNPAPWYFTVLESCGE